MKRAKRQIEEWLDERYSIINMLSRPSDRSYYEGALRALEFAGYDWIRNEKGKHKLFI